MIHRNAAPVRSPAWSAALLAAAIFLAPTLLQSAQSPLGTHVKDFQLNDCLGTRRSLNDWKDKKAVVVVFLGTECPLVKLYGSRLADLAARYHQNGVQFIGINSNQQDSLPEIAKFAAQSKIDFPILKDPGNQIADQFQATRTPEVFVLDKDRTVRYHGAIDDQYGVGFTRPEAKHSYLSDALDQILSDKPIATPTITPVGCHIGRVNRTQATGDVTYSKQIAAIVNKRCVHCHRLNQIGPFALTSYSEVAPWAETICEVIRDQRMPPWHANPQHGHFRNDPRLPDAEKELIYQWVKNGLPEGNPSDLPTPPTFTPGWRIPQPDLVIRMPTAFEVPAKGTIPYQYFIVDPGFKEDVWIRGSEGRPGNHSVVHHMIVYFSPPKKAIHPLDPLINAVASYVPGMPVEVGPGDEARRIPAGSKLIFQMHYTANGVKQQDQSEAGFLFADPAKVKKEITLGAALNWQFEIPAGAKDHRVDAKIRFDQDKLLHSLIPHMHWRGKSFRITAIYSGNRQEVLLDVPRYDFNWQNAYLFEKPHRMPEGSFLHCEAHFDNSVDNPVNPDPTRAVRWGDQTWEEMVVGSFTMSMPEQDLSLGLPQQRPLEDGRYEVRFRYKPSSAVKSVNLAGEFNDWKTNAQSMTGPDADGFYVTTIPLATGRYEYKFVLDGKTWKQDPGNPTEANVYHNSVLLVGGKVARTQDSRAEH
jgi:peroxiredoxin